MDAPRPRSRRPAEERRAQILEAALQCFGEKGFHTATMDDLVRASGLSKGSLYWHFESKQEVFLAVFDAFAESVFAEWDALLEAGHGTIDALEQVTLGMFDEVTAAGTRDAWAEFFAHPQARARFATLYREVRARLERTLARDIEQGRVRPLPAAALAAALTAAAEGLGLQALVDTDFDLRGNWAVTREMICKGIEP